MVSLQKHLMLSNAWWWLVNWLANWASERANTPNINHPEDREKYHTKSSNSLWITVWQVLILKIIFHSPLHTCHVTWESSAYYWSMTDTHSTFSIFFIESPINCARNAQLRILTWSQLMKQTTYPYLTNMYITWSITL